MAAAAEAAFPGADGRLIWVEKEVSDTSISYGDAFLVLQRPAPGEPDDQIGGMDCLNTVEGRQRTLCPYFRPTFSPDGRTVLLGTVRPLTDRYRSPRRAVLALADPDDRGVSPRALPDLTDSDREPGWAPDGERLVFVGRLAGVSDLFVVGLDGGGLRRLTFGGGVERRPVWSTRGDVAFERGRGIWSIRADGGGGLRRLAANGHHPDWSPDGRRMVFDREGRIYTSLRSGGGVRRLAGAGSYPAWSPSGRRIAFRHRYDIYTADPDGTRRKRVYNWMPSQGSRPARRYAPRDIDWGPRRG